MHSRGRYPMDNVTRYRNLPVDYSLRKYLQQITSIPLLGEVEEHELAMRWCERGDQQALDKLVRSHLRLVVKIAMGYRGYGLPVADLISEGSVGLIKAARRFDPD